MNHKREIAMALVLRAIDDDYLPTLNCVELLHFNNCMGTALRSAHEIEGGMVREKDENGDACSAYDVIKAALAYHNPPPGDLRMPLHPEYIDREPKNFSYRFKKFLRRLVYKWLF